MQHSDDSTKQSLRQSLRIVPPSPVYRFAENAFLDHVPEALYELHQWCLWAGRWDHSSAPPRLVYDHYNPDGLKINPTDPLMWTSIEACAGAVPTLAKACQDRPAYAGVGLALVVPAGGAWAGEVIEALPTEGTFGYVERRTDGRLTVIAPANGTPPDTTEVFPLTGEALDGQAQVPGHDTTCAAVSVDPSRAERNAAYDWYEALENLPPRDRAIAIVTEFPQHAPWTDYPYGRLLDEVRREDPLWWAELLADRLAQQGAGVVADAPASASDATEADEDDEDSEDSEDSREYAFRADGLFQRRRTRRKGKWVTHWKRLTNFVCTMTKDISYDDDTGGLPRRAAELTGWVCDGPHKGEVRVGEVPVEELDTTRWIKSVLGCSAKIFKGRYMAEEVNHALNRMSLPPYVGPEALAAKDVHQTLGWKVINGVCKYLSGQGAITAEGLDTSTIVETGGNLSRYRLPAPPEGESRRTAIDASLALRGLLADGKMWALLGTTYLAPLRTLFEDLAPDFVTWLHGRSGLYKSEIAALMQSHFGRFEKRCLPATFAGTANSLERISFMAKDSLLVVDDFHPANSKRDDEAMQSAVERLVRGVGNGMGRQRMNPDTTLKADLPPRCTVLATGERLPTTQSTAARCFLVNLRPPDDPDAMRTRLTDAQKARPRYAEAMSGYVQWIAEHWDQLSTRLIDAWETLRNEVCLVDAHARQGSQVAYLLIGLDTWLTYAVDCGALTEDRKAELFAEAKAALLAQAADHSTVLHEEQPEQRALALLQDAFASKSAYLETLNGQAPTDADAYGWIVQERVWWGPPTPTPGDAPGPKSGEASKKAPDTALVEHRTIERLRPPGAAMLGYLGANYLYLLPEATFGFLSQRARQQGTVFPLDQRSLVKALDEAHYLATEPGHRTKVLKVGTGRVRCLWIDRVTFDTHPTPRQTPLPVSSSGVQETPDNSNTSEGENTANTANTALGTREGDCARTPHAANGTGDDVDTPDERSGQACTNRVSLGESGVPGVYGQNGTVTTEKTTTSPDTALNTGRGVPPVFGGVQPSLAYVRVHPEHACPRCAEVLVETLTWRTCPKCGWKESAIPGVPQSEGGCDAS